MERVTIEKYGNARDGGVPSADIDIVAVHRVSRAFGDLFGREGNDYLSVQYMREILCLALEHGTAKPQAPFAAYLIEIRNPEDASFSHLAVSADDERFVRNAHGIFEFVYTRRSLRAGHEWLQVWSRETRCTVEAVVAVDPTYPKRNPQIAAAVDRELAVARVCFFQLVAIWNSQEPEPRNSRGGRPYFNEVRDTLINLATD